MAPATRRQAAGASSVKKAPPARKPRATRQEPPASEDWNFISRDPSSREDTNDQENETPDFDMDGRNGDTVVPTRELPDVAETMRPLREMAERVGAEVETFAEKLDQFLDNLPTRNKFDAVLELVDQFKGVAQVAATTLEEIHEAAARRERQKEWEQKANISTQTAGFGVASSFTLAASTTGKTAESVKHLRQWQQEVDIWELFRIMLELHHNPDARSVQQEKEDKLRALGDVHRFTPEKDIWERFLVENDLAKERSVVKTWLEQTAEHQESDIKGIQEELEKKAGANSGLWSNGWVHTRAKIKGEKRLRPWPNTPGSALPHITRSDDSAPLVTNLDPDAASRQGRNAEKKDAFFERAMWITCWEMLRQGKSWEYICKWCQDRDEGWRALSMGKTDLSEALSTSTWRNMCYLASNSKGTIDYEAAVYALLGGNIEPAQKVAKTVDENLYVYYSAALIRQFDIYLEMYYPDRAPKKVRGSADLSKDPDTQIVELIMKLRKQPTTGREAIHPMKIIQSYLLANDVGSLIHTLGFAIAYTARQRGEADKMILDLKPFWQESTNQPEAEVALNPQTLRIATHMGIMIRMLAGEMARKENEERNAEENVYVAYVQYLRAAGKRELIPLYVSKLHASRYIVTMAEVLGDITSTTEQDVMLRLMRNYDLDVVKIINEQLQFLMDKYMRTTLEPHARQSAKILEKMTDNTSLYPGQRIILGFLSEKPVEGDDAILRALRWFSLVEGYWQDTFAAFSFALRKCLVSGRLACARRIIEQYPYENIALRKTYQILGRSINPFDHEGEPPCSRAKWESLKRTSRCYYELELLVLALVGLADWRSREAEYTHKTLRMSSAPTGLKQTKDHVDANMVDVLTRNILTHPVTTDEEKDLRIVRREYIPEMIIAYNTVLHSAGSIISRDNLLQSMDLSVTIANDQYGLHDCIMQAGRMQELVTSFAQTAKAMLILKAEGKPWKPRKDREGKDLGIWEIGPQGRSAREGLDVEL